MAATLKYASWRPPFKLWIAGWDFEGPYPASSLADRPGAYAVLDVLSDGSIRNCIDVGESAEVATRVGSHDRERCWAQHTSGRRAFAVLYTDGRDDDYRSHIEQSVRASTFPPCGAF